MTSHALRKTTATLLDAAGCSAREIADQLGHAKPSMTTDVYLGRQAEAHEQPRRLSRWVECRRKLDGVHVVDDVSRR